MAGRPKTTETPEFKAAVAAEVSQAMADFKADLFATLQATGSPGAPQGGAVTDVLSEVLSKLSMNLQGLNEKGQYNKPRSPEEIMRCEAGQKRMVDLIMAARQDGAEKPAYRLSSKVYLNERFIEPYRIIDKATKATGSTEITWTGVPNDAMIPANPAAEAIFAAWREATGGPTPLVPTADRRPLWVTAAGLVVKGDAQSRRVAAAETEYKDEVGLPNGDPAAPEVAVLGTIARKARQNGVAGVL